MPAALHPQVQAVLEAMAKLNLPAPQTVTPAQARLNFKQSRGVFLPQPEAVAAANDYTVAGPGGAIPVRLYRPMGAAPSAKLPVLIYFHGGGWVLGDIETHDPLCRVLANRSGCAVLSVDYRLAPEHKFPAAVEDAVAVARYVAASGAAWGIDGSRIALGGDSAGGNLATVVALTLRDAGGPALRLQLMLYPATDFSMDAPSHREFANGYMLTRERMQYFSDCYLRGTQDVSDWRASPLKATDVSRLPPALIITASHDPLRDEGKAYADRLNASGVRATYRCYDGMIHGFMTMSGAVNMAGEAIDAAAAAVKQALV
jgi:acetyl esterase